MNSRCWARAYVCRKNESTPPPPPPLRVKPPARIQKGVTNSHAIHLPVKRHSKSGPRLFAGCDGTQYFQLHCQIRQSSIKKVILFLQNLRVKEVDLLNRQSSVHFGIKDSFPSNMLTNIQSAKDYIIILLNQTYLYISAHLPYCVCVWGGGGGHTT